MRIAIPSDDQQTIAGHTGRCRGFMIYDVAKGIAQKIEYRPNTFTHHHHAHDGQGHGHEHHHHGEHNHDGLLSGLQDCDAVVALGMGHRLINDLQSRGMIVRFSQERDIERAASAFASGEFVDNPAGSACHR